MGMLGRFFISPEDIDEIIYRHEELKKFVAKLPNSSKPKALSQVHEPEEDVSAAPSGFFARLFKSKKDPLLPPPDKKVKNAGAVSSLNLNNKEVARNWLISQIKKDFPCLDDLDDTDIAQQVITWRIKRDASGMIKTARFYFGSVAVALGAGSGGYAVGMTIAAKIFTFFVVGAAATAPIAPLWVGLVGGLSLMLIIAVGAYIVYSTINTNNIKHQIEVRNALRESKKKETANPNAVFEDLRSALDPAAQQQEQHSKLFDAITSYNALESKTQQQIQSNLSAVPGTAPEIIKDARDEKIEALQAKIDTMQNDIKRGFEGLTIQIQAVLVREGVLRNDADGEDKQPGSGKNLRGVGAALRGSVGAPPRPSSHAGLQAPASSAAMFQPVIPAVLSATSTTVSEEERLRIELEETKRQLTEAQKQLATGQQHRTATPNSPAL